MNEIELESATFVRDHQAQLRRYQAAVERARDVDACKARLASVQVELRAATERVKELERRASNEKSRSDSLSRELGVSDRARVKLAQELDEQHLANATMHERLDHAQAVSTELIGRVEQANEVNDKVIALLKEAVRRETSQREVVTPEYGRQAAEFVELAARIAVAVAPPEYRPHIEDVASAARRIVGQPADRVWRAWAEEAGRFAKKCTGAPVPDDSNAPAGTREAPANRPPRYERGVLVPLGDGRVRVQVVGMTDDSRCTLGFGIVRGGQLIRARLGVPGLLVLLPRRGAGSSYAREVLTKLTRLFPDQVVEGRLEAVRDQLGLEATLPTVQSALERVAVISRGVLFHPVEKTWRVCRARLDQLNIAEGALDIEIERQDR
ncbi:MAG: hypothetical protein KC468_22645 [Myxococcales bacterium]|nr:hypothetical protein [Myxococcales bacterium]